jgi:hypothetical protein
MRQLMKRFGPITETSRVETAEPSPVTERVGRYLFWALVVAVLFARAIYAPTSHPIEAGTYHQAKTEAAR